MKSLQLFIAVLIGLLLGFGISKLYTNKNDAIQNTTIKKSAPLNADTTKWKYPDSLDALIAAPDNHKIVYEDSNVRVLQVVLNALKAEPIHTHKYKSIAWVTKPITPCRVYIYDYDKNNKLVIVDSITKRTMPINEGGIDEPEGPTSIKNLSNDNGILYRVEFKKEFK